jgi:predicted O-methyltransferase YrrM
MRDAFQQEGLRRLCNWANDRGAKNKAVEIGAYSGEGTMILANYFDEVLAVDPWLNGYDINDRASQQTPMKFVFAKFLENTKDLGNVNYDQNKSLDALEAVKDGSLDLVYVDGDHRYEAVLADFKGWLPKLRAGGVMAGHDWSFKDVQKALAEVFVGKESVLFQGDSWALIP